MVTMAQTSSNALSEKQSKNITLGVSPAASEPTKIGNAYVDFHGLLPTLQENISVTSDRTIHLRLNGQEVNIGPNTEKVDIRAVKDKLTGEPTYIINTEDYPVRYGTSQTSEARDSVTMKIDPKGRMSETRTVVRYDGQAEFAAGLAEAQRYGANDGYDISLKTVLPQPGEQYGRRVVQQEILATDKSGNTSSIGFIIPTRSHSEALKTTNEVRDEIIGYLDAHRIRDLSTALRAANNEDKSDKGKQLEELLSRHPEPFPVPPSESERQLVQSMERAKRDHELSLSTIIEPGK